MTREQEDVHQQAAGTGHEHPDHTAKSELSAGDRWRQEHHAELVEYRKKRHVAKQPRITEEELERLRLPKNRQEACDRGICLNCGRIGKNISHHLCGCPGLALMRAALAKDNPASATLSPSDAYKEYWGFDRSNPLTSIEQREAYSRSHRQSPTFPEQQEKARKALLVARAARKGSKRGPMRLESKLKRRGKTTGARPHRQNVPDIKVLEVRELNLTLAESAKCLPMSQTALYRRGQRLGFGWKAGRTLQQRVLRRMVELGDWIALQPQTPTAVEQITQHYVDDLRRGRQTPSRELSSFIRHLEGELRERPATIAEIATEVAEKKLRPKTLSAASRVSQRMRKKPAPQLAVPKTESATPASAAAKKSRGGQEGVRRSTEPRIVLAADLIEIKGIGRYEAARQIYPEQKDRDNAYTNLKSLYRRHGDAIRAQKERLLSLLEADRRIAVEDARRQIGGDRVH